MSISPMKPFVYSMCHTVSFITPLYITHTLFEMTHEVRSGGGCCGHVTCCPKRRDRCARNLFCFRIMLQYSTKTAVVNTRDRGNKPNETTRRQHIIYCCSLPGSLYQDNTCALQVHTYCVRTDVTYKPLCSCKPPPPTVA